LEVVSRPSPGGETLGEAEVPVRASGLELLGEMSHSGFRDPPRLVRRIDGQVLQLTPLLYEVLAAIDGRRTHRDIAEVVTTADGKRLSPDDVTYLVAEKLRPLGVLRRADGSEPEVEKANPLLALRWRFVVSNPKATAALTHPFTWLFRPPVIALSLAAFAASVWWVLFRHGVGVGLREMLYDPSQFVLVVGLTALSAGFHELGHAAACRYGGANPGVMGAGLYLVWPAFYTDVTDSYRLDRRGRLRTDLGGLYFNCLFTVLTVAAAQFTGADSLLVLVPLQLLQMVHQLIPILRLDGYHILADLTGVPDLYGRIRPTLRSALPGTETDERAAALRTGVRRTVTAWVVIVVPLLVFTIGSAALALPRVLATAGDSISLRWEAVGSGWARGNPFEIIAGLLSIAALVLPIAGTVLIVQRIAARAWSYLWNRFDSRPARSALAVVALVTLIALVGALWPHGNYRPLQAEERLTVEELPVVRAVATRSLDPLLDTSLGAGSDGALATGLTIEGDDNLAVAINTADGASVFRLAFAIRSIAGGVVDQTNSAVALASCTACSTVALAFQVLLIFDDPTALTPENRATALNVACQSCLTFAAATQIILGFDEPMALTEEGERRIAEVHQTLLDLEQRAPSLDPETLAAEVAAAKEELVAILEEELVPLTPADESDPDATTEEEPTADESTETDMESDGETDGTESPDGETSDTDGETTTTTSSDSSESSTTTTSAA
jgi:putative peptide zinc metalloprotease protein